MPAKNQPLRIESRNPKIRENFRKARLSLNKTQREMALDLTVKESYIRHIENGHINPSSQKMIMFESYFQLPAKELFNDLYKNVSRN